MIGKVIKSLLDANDDLTALVPAARIFPYVINENTPLPAILYTIDNIDPEYNKDGWCGDDYNFSVVTFCNDYSSLQDISYQVRKSLELMRGNEGSINFRPIYLTGQSEGFNIDNDVYLNKLTFNVKITGF
jgi:hypothetical protein